ncbi:MAG TPA: flagellar assembly protein FliH [Azonexus sp.]|nr:flagellar assembly protein FliH [Azonexus sp.]
MIIPKEELTHFQRWQAGSFDAKPAPAPAPETPTSEAMPAQSDAGTLETIPEFNLPTAEDIERIHEEARASGYEAGLAEGRQSGEQEARARLDAQSAALASIIGNLRNAVGELEQSVADDLLSLAIEIAAQVTRSAISVKPELLLPTIREAITTLPLHHAHIVLRLNPRDIEHVRAQIGEQLAQTGAQLLEDSTVSPGGCLLQAGASEVDATIETRWKRVLEAIGTEPREWLNP